MISNLPRNVRRAMEASCRGLDHRVELPWWTVVDPDHEDAIIQFLAAVKPAGDASAMQGEREGEATTIYCFRRESDAASFRERFASRQSSPVFH